MLAMVHINNDNIMCVQKTQRQHLHNIASFLTLAYAMVATCGFAFGFSVLHIPNQLYCLAFKTDMNTNLETDSSSVYFEFSSNIFCEQFNYVHGVYVIYYPTTLMSALLGYLTSHYFFLPSEHSCQVQLAIPVYFNHSLLCMCHKCVPVHKLALSL